MQLRTLGLHGVCSELAAMSRVCRVRLAYRRTGVCCYEDARIGRLLAARIVGRVVELECGCRKGGCLDVVVWCVLLGAQRSGPDAV